ncbi:NAD(P)-dependent oxidoreductase [Actinokineospora auranticolor]|uniref:Phosphoglycerate dehydrogenase-like enzyme n=1 Tax=Actinokineospora auranticolor TaxID=155976 RepID=A0A2S6GKS6_9PSEU|nr:NAD(P)-dependent oxidoreductase [Actinokineospora auranticolor]PPK65842.1 phosphoglycerate dehydrogenase-like enzyme [Actinokineospora auranticolor]
MTPPVRVLVSCEEDDQVGHDLLSQTPGLEVIPYDPNSPDLDSHQASAHVLIPPYRSSHRPIRLLPLLPNLRMVQLLSAGTDEWAPHVPYGITLSNAHGAHAGPVSEWILSAILTQYRQWPALVRFQDQAIWAHRKFHADTLAGTRVLIIGAGSIGMATARRLKAFEAVPTLVARTARDGVHATTDLPALIPGHQIVVLTAPLTEATRGLVNAEFLATMNTGALLVNAARGQIVDTTALVHELQQERLTAALDVVDPEPLPSGHPLWSCPGVLISPHSARTVPRTNELCYSAANRQICDRALSG